jgi:hypothetical protein
MAAGPFVLGIGSSDSAAAELLASTATGKMFDWDADPSGFIRDVAAARYGEAGGGCGLRSIFPERVAQQRGADRPSPAAYSRRALTAQLVTLLSALSH